MPAWSADEVALAFKLKEANYREREILAYFPGRTRSALESMFRRERRLPSRPKHWRKTVGVHSFKVPDDIWAEADRRANEPRAGGGMQGEPPFSQSALGRPCE